MKSKTQSNSIVIFGVSGNLARSKLLPAIRDLRKKKKLPKKFKVIGFSRSLFLSDGVQHVQGNYDDPQSYRELAELLGSRNVFYLAVPPSTYPSIIHNLAKTELVKNSKILIEKPFGESYKTAISLNKSLLKYFKESQIYRVDHYLGKESMQQFAKARLELKKIRKVEINLFQKEKVGDRGKFYDKVGALKDVGQNHMLQMLALLMAGWRNKEKFLKSLKTIKHAERGQYRGYLKEKGVAKNSKTETFFRIETESYVLSSGKKMNEEKNEIKVLFKDGKKKIFKIKRGGYEKVISDAIQGNRLIFPTISEVLAQWKFTELVMKKLRKSQLTIY